MASEYHSRESRMELGLSSRRSSDQALAFSLGRGSTASGSERQRPLNGLVGCGGDGDIDGLEERVATLSEAAGGLPDAEGRERQPAGQKRVLAPALARFPIAASPETISGLVACRRDPHLRLAGVPCSGADRLSKHELGSPGKIRQSRARKGSSSHSTGRATVAEIKNIATQTGDVFPDVVDTGRGMLVTRVSVPRPA
jgi:hypothetical protein